MIKRAPPAWICKYKKDYEEGRITKEEIFRQENADREAKNEPEIKIKSVNRAINALGFSYTYNSLKPVKSKPVQEQKIKTPEPSAPSSPSKPCFRCRYYTKKHICEYPLSMFVIYPELSDFDRDFSEGQCKLKER